MPRFHTAQANASISASTRKRKNFDPCACAYACVMLASLVKTRLKKEQEWILNPKESQNGLCISLLNRSIQDLPDPGASKEPKNSLWERIYFDTP